MARGLSSSTLLNSTAPSAAAKGQVTIGHIQLRDVLICPHERGIVYYPQADSIVEHDISSLNNHSRRVAELGFVANSLSTYTLPGTQETILAAGGQEAELHLSMYHPPSLSSPFASDSERRVSSFLGKQKWMSQTKLAGAASINNSVQLMNMNLTGSHMSSVEPRLMISNNDSTVKFFDIAVRSGKYFSAQSRMSQVGELRLDVAVNHSSISPDHRTLLSVGDSPDVYLHRITGSSTLSFSPIAKLSLSPYINTTPSIYASTTTPTVASFSTAFSSNGSKFAVASQEGVVVVWDVRSTKPLKVIQTDKNRDNQRMRAGNGAASGWLFELPWDWRGAGPAPGWGVRSVKFSPPGAGKEIMTFTEHTSLLHVLDARTFETEEIVRMPSFEHPAPSSTRAMAARPRSHSPPPRNSPSLSSSTVAFDTSSSSNLTTSNPLPPPPRILLFSGAVEDTFRIPISDPYPARRRRFRRRLNRQGEDSSGTSSGTNANGSSMMETDYDDLVVIPPPQFAR
ncbi:hypothetical protein K474DRAFT_1657182 [Panus rudis PR-1116 ss-1]|nr:hypothetical protein K474DRAFT_1657182 [Panus rudis PR-1116 ss-1]